MVPENTISKNSHISVHPNASNYEAKCVSGLFIKKNLIEGNLAPDTYLHVKGYDTGVLRMRLMIQTFLTASKYCRRVLKKDFVVVVLALFI